jgi:hypothetical protein
MPGFPLRVGPNASLSARVDAEQLARLRVIAFQHADLRHDERLRAHHARRRFDFLVDRPPVGHAEAGAALLEHVHVRIRAQDLLLQVLLQSGHDRNDRDERHYAHEDAADRDERDQREEPAAPPRREVAPRDEPLRPFHPLPPGT